MPSVQQNYEAAHRPTREQSHAYTVAITSLTRFTQGSAAAENAPFPSIHRLQSLPQTFKSYRSGDLASRPPASVASQHSLRNFPWFCRIPALATELICTVHGIIQIARLPNRSAALPFATNSFSTISSRSFALSPRPYVSFLAITTRLRFV